MHPDAGVQPHIDTRRLVIQMTTTGTDERDGEVSHLALRGPPLRHPFGPVPPIEEQPIRTVDEHIGDALVGEILGDGPESRVQVREDRGRCTTERGARSEDERFSHAPTLGRHPQARDPGSHRLCTSA